jgi:peptidoglycan/LPS O-acetylase OafA/YrhL
MSVTGLPAPELNQRSIPSLDGLRALSVALVLLGHLSGTRNFPTVPAWVSGYATFGVRIFFVISGFLITTLLLKERAKRGSISLKEFYLRRVFRIFPAAYVYLLAVAVFAGIGIWHFAAAIFYVSNYDYGRPWLLGHLWSLAVEEQFYLLWPLALLLFFRKRKAIAIATICISPLLRIAYFSGLGAHLGWRYIDWSFPTVADALAMGCLLALVYPSFSKLVARFGKWFAIVPITTALIPLMPYYFSTRAYNFLGISLMNFGIALTILHAMEHKYRVLNWRPVALMGAMSYSLYLWQQPFLNRDSNGWWAAFPANIVMVFGAAALSYYAVEQPMLRMRQKWFGKVKPLNSNASAKVAAGLLPVPRQL